MSPSPGLSVHQICPKYVFAISFINITVLMVSVQALPKAENLFLFKLSKFWISDAIFLSTHWQSSSSSTVKGSMPQQMI